MGKSRKEQTHLQLYTDAVDPEDGGSTSHRNLTVQHPSTPRY